MRTCLELRGVVVLVVEQLVDLWVHADLALRANQARAIAAMPAVIDPICNHVVLDVWPAKRVVRVLRVHLDPFLQRVLEARAAAAA